MIILDVLGMLFSGIGIFLMVRRGGMLLVRRTAARKASQYWYQEVPAPPVPPPSVAALLQERRRLEHEVMAPISDAVTEGEHRAEEQWAQEHDEPGPGRVIDLRDQMAQIKKATAEKDRLETRVPWSSVPVSGGGGIPPGLGWSAPLAADDVTDQALMQSVNAEMDKLAARFSDHAAPGQFLIDPAVPALEALAFLHHKRADLINVMAAMAGQPALPGTDEKWNWLLYQIAAIDTRISDFMSQ